MSKADKLRALGSAGAGVAALMDETPYVPPRIGEPILKGVPDYRLTDRLLRFGVSLPLSVVERLRDVQYYLRRTKRGVSISGLMEVSVRAFLDLDEDAQAEMIDRYNGRARRKTFERK